MADKNMTAVGEWLTYADNDLGVAEHLLTSYRPLPAWIVCFHAQQAAEKAIKAVIAAKKGVAAIPPPTNDLRSLLKKTECHVDDAQKDACNSRCAETLARYADDEAFPVDGLSLTERDAKEAVEMAKDLVAWCKSVIPCERDRYKRLEIDFEIPEILERTINEFLIDLNEKRGRLADCYEVEIRSLLNCCDLCLTKDQIELLREYYYRGGIYDAAGGYRESWSVHDGRPRPPGDDKR